MPTVPPYPQGVEHAIKRVQQAQRHDRLTPVVSWQALTLTGGWTAAGGAYAPAGYFKDRHGVVRLRGRVVPPGSPLGTVLGTLPEGYRPEYTESWCVPAGGTTPGVVHLDVAPDGTITHMGTSNIITSLQWVALQPVRFRASPVSLGGAGAVIGPGFGVPGSG